MWKKSQRQHDFFIYFGFFMVATACSATLDIDSTPSQAYVSIERKTAAGIEKQTLGQTPLHIDSGKLPVNTVVLHIEKQGYQARSLVMASPRSTGDSLDINIALTVQQGSSAQQTVMLFNLFTIIKKNIESKQYRDALTGIDSAFTVNDQIAAFYALQGNVFYLQKKFKLAKTSWEHAHALEPDSSVQKLIRQLEDQGY